MVGCAVYMVDSQGVGSKLLHQPDIPLTLFSIHKRIVWQKLVGYSYLGG